MEFTLCSENFKLELSLTVYQEDLACSSNTTMDVTVQSDGFSASTTMDIDIKDLEKFAVDLCRIYHDLSGEARIEEPYGVHMYLSFQGDGRGHIAVKGYLQGTNRTGGEQALTFENQIDQTLLIPFCLTLKNACSTYTR